MATGEGLVLRPFRGVRYAQDRVDLAAVTSPPYDLIAPGDVERLERQEPHNVVRLVLGDRDAVAPERYARTGTLLREWLSTGALARDPAAALYVHEQRSRDHLQRGLIGAVELRAAQDRVILPHEDVHPGPVADRLAQMRATGANLEPIYLLVPGMGAATEVVDSVADDQPALVDATTPDGTRQRLWALRDGEMLRTVAAALRERQALIADGHHRYATYGELQAAYHQAEYGAGPWDAGLALLVDSAAYPPALHPIHRVVAGLPPDTLLRSLPADSTRTGVDPDLTAGLAALRQARGPSRSSFLVVGGGEHVLVTLPHTGIAAAMPGDHSAAWRGLDVTVLHHAVLDGLLPGEDTVSFVHDPAAAVRMADGSGGGTAVLLNPPSVDEVTQVAATAERMPRKSTSFGPKPRNGWVLRLLDES
ncbi:MAG: DUF1015 family protein [Streptosporangiales bacterium]